MTEKKTLTEKKCYVCQEVKPVNEFYVNRTRKCGYQAMCIQCTKNHNKVKYSTDKDAWYAARRNNYLRRKFGIGLNDWIALYESQDGKCKICKTHNTKRTLHVDHNHISGQVRGLLCARCNQGLGSFLENPEYLNNAISYLKEYSDNVDPDN